MYIDIFVIKVNFNVFYLSRAIMLFDIRLNIIPFYIELLYYRHADVVTSASEKNFNSGDMALDINKSYYCCYY